MLIWTKTKKYLIEITNSHFLAWVGLDIIKSIHLINIMANTDKPVIKAEKDRTSKDTTEIYLNTVFLSFIKAIPQKWRYMIILQEI